MFITAEFPAGGDSVRISAVLPGRDYGRERVIITSAPDADIEQGEKDTRPMAGKIGIRMG